MKFALTQKIVTFALALVAAVPVLFCGEISYPFIVLCTLLAIAGWFIKSSWAKKKRFRQFANVITVGLLIVQVARIVLGAPAVVLVMEFAAVLLGIKLCSRARASDYYQIVILSFLHIIAATIVMDDLFYAVSFLLFVCLGPSALSLTYLRSEMERRFGSEDKPGATLMLERLLNSRRIISPGFLFFSSFLSIPVILITVVMFLAFPRVGMGLLGRLPTGGATVGFGNSVTLGDLDIVRFDETVLMRFETVDSRGVPPAILPLRIRGAVFDVFDNNTWKKSEATGWEYFSQLGGEHFLTDKKTALIRAQFGDYSISGLQVLLKTFEPPLVFVPENVGKIVTDSVSKQGKINPRRLERNGFGELRYDDNAKVGLNYRTYFSSAASLGQPPDENRDYLQLPPSSESLKVLAHQMAGDGDDAQRARRLMEGLQAGYGYSLRLSDSPKNKAKDTPLERFLFTRKTGTCEHFATALTLMLRAEGIPARIVTGFANAELNSMGGYYVVRQRFAHSWTEAYLRGKWVTMDATPSDVESGERRTPSALTMFLDAVAMRWHKHVVSYNAAAQADIAIGVWHWWLKNVRNKKSERLSWWPFAMAGGLALGMVLVVILRKRLRPRGMVARLAKQPTVDKKRLKDATRLYLKLEKALKKLGVPRTPTMTADELLATLGRHAGHWVDDARAIINRYSAVRFGRDIFKEGELGRLNALIKKMPKR